MLRANTTSYDNVYEFNCTLLLKYKLQQQTILDYKQLTRHHVTEPQPQILKAEPQNTQHPLFCCPVLLHKR